MTKVGVIDLRLSNLGSVVGCATSLNADVVVCRRPEDLAEFDRIIIPGVGSYRFAMEQLRADGWGRQLDERVFARGVPVLGICLGMHLLGDVGVEGGATEGLAKFSGIVQQLEVGALPLPHMGWNSVQHADDRLFEGIPSGADFYFAHSFGFASAAAPTVIATATYGSTFPVAIRVGTIVGVQFHPEKSSLWGLRLMRNFLFGEA